MGEGKSLSNYDAALKAEAKKVIRCFQSYTTDQVSLLRSRSGRPSRKAVDRGEFYYIHPELHGVCFSTRGDAARAALRTEQDQSHG